MKSNVNEDRYFIECCCGSIEHLLIFEIWDKKMMDHISVYFSGNWKQVWYRRIWIGFKYIFGKKPYCWSDEVLINSHNLKQLEEFVELLKSQRSK